MWFNFWRPLLRDTRGVVVVYAAMGTAVFLGLLALVVDDGNLMWQKQRMQHAVDAAALAGVADLPERPDLANQDALQTGENNGLRTSEISATVDGANTTVTTSAVRTVHLTFAAALGFKDPVIHVHAAAKLSGLTSVKGAVPLGVSAGTSLSYGTEVTLKAGAATNGAFGALVMSGTGASSFQNDLQYGYANAVSVGQVLYTQTGEMSGATQKAIQYRLSMCPMNGAATYMDHPANCPLIILIPVYQPVAYDTNNQVKQVQVVGFATFFLEGVSSTSSGSSVTGRFMQYAVNGDMSASQTTYGAYGYKLVQ